MTDLVIGTRRTSPRRTVRGVAIASLAVVVALIVAYMIYRRVVSYVMPGGSVASDVVETSQGPVEGGDIRLAFGDSSMSHAGGISVLRLVGKPHTLGVAHGRLLGDAVSDSSHTLTPSIEQTVSSGGIFGGLTHTARLRWRHRLLDDGVPGHQLLEIAGVLRGVRRSVGAAPDYERFVRSQAVLDLGVPARWSSGFAFRAVSRALSFVAPLRGAGGDRLLVGRSFGMPGVADDGATLTRGLTIFFVHPESVIPFASVGWPGMVGVVSGLNAEGIAVMVHPARTSDVRTTREAQPVTLLARDILENARTLEEAISILEHAKPLGAAAFVLVDGNERTWAVVERSPERIAVARNPSPAVVTDILTAEAFADDPENDRARRVRPSSMRAQRTAELLRQRPPAHAEDAAMILRDTRAVGALPLPHGHRGAVQDVSAAHTALFDASGMVLWVADGPGAQGRFRAFDLRHELRGEGGRPAPPPDLPAADSDASAERAVVFARSALREARRALEGGHRARAREMVQRALAHAPDLPEALVLAGDLAHRKHDDDAARSYYRRFLDVGPDDLGAAERVGALLRDY